MEIIRLKKKHFFKNLNKIDGSSLEEKIKKIEETNSYNKKKTTRFKHVPNKKTKKRHYFSNENFLHDVKQSYKTNMKYALMNIPLLILVFILVYYEIAMVLTQVIIIWLGIVVLGTIFSIFGPSKKLILKNKYIYETDFLGDRRRKFEFNTIKIHNFKNFSIVYFEEYKSPVFISVDDPNKFEEFFNDYLSASTQIKGNRLVT